MIGSPRHWVACAKKAFLNFRFSLIKQIQPLALISLTFWIILCAYKNLKGNFFLWGKAPMKVHFYGYCCIANELLNHLLHATPSTPLHLIVSLKNHLYPPHGKNSHGNFKGNSRREFFIACPFFVQNNFIGVASGKVHFLASVINRHSRRFKA